ncbi:uncharacterized protein LOC129924101 [Biomphalaria glabrata]|uniref:Uncharacterized protein LOC129924101 n=1 Tax=Biomphalaria glabrata TaxID=6526 RepID=A0A9W2ZG11_BIOGL|nr:uncharacterized protein LOC129924101 [Biomphalaria glabrata]
MSYTTEAERRVKMQRRLVIIYTQPAIAAVYQGLASLVTQEVAKVKDRLSRCKMPQNIYIYIYMFTGFDLVIPLQKHQHIISIHSSSNDLHMKQHHAELTSPTEESFHHALATIQKQNEKVVSLFGTSPERPSESGSTLLLTSSVSYDQHNDQQPLLFEPKSGLSDFC